MPVCIAGIAVVAAGTALAASTSSSSVAVRPVGIVNDCSHVNGIPGAGLRDFGARESLVVGPLAVLHANPVLGFSSGSGGNKLFVLVKGGHRVTLELSRETRRNVGFVVHDGRPHGGVGHRYTRRVVTFRACDADNGRREDPYLTPATDWPVSGWVGFLVGRGPRCVPLNVWVDDEPEPRRTVIRFGVRSCE
jgi:hypothetical protein